MLPSLDGGKPSVLSKRTLLSLLCSIGPGAVLQAEIVAGGVGGICRAQTYPFTMQAIRVTQRTFWILGSAWVPLILPSYPSVRTSQDGS